MAVASPYEKFQTILENILFIVDEEKNSHVPPWAKIDRIKEICQYALIRVREEGAGFLPDRTPLKEQPNENRA